MQRCDSIKDVQGSARFLTEPYRGTDTAVLSCHNLKVHM